MVVIIIFASLVSSFVISDMSQVERCKKEKSETEYCKEKTAEKPSIFGSEE